MIKCQVCGKILHSLSRHDFQQCDCPNESFVDGGYDYMRVGGADLSKIEVIDHEHDSGRKFGPSGKIGASSGYGPRGKIGA